MQRPLWSVKSTLRQQTFSQSFCVSFSQVQPDTSTCWSFPLCLGVQPMCMPGTSISLLPAGTFGGPQVCAWLLLHNLPTYPEQCITPTGMLDGLGYETRICPVCLVWLCCV